jgi:RTX calcium-binding nonapeptide repeat (4 copies)
MFPAAGTKTRRFAWRRTAGGRAALISVALASLGFLTFPTVAGTAAQIVIHGAKSGPHLRLKLDGDNLLVKGHMTPTAPTGCRFIQQRIAAVCPLADVGSILIDMGHSGDLVEVLEALPIPVTAYLGGGSDKFIGNGEADTCYPQGSKRNRCTGGAGDDICITGPRNSDCIGGQGDDYCEGSTGSDGCWGGPGDDVCYMGPGKDGCHGDAGNDLLYEGSGSGKLYGGRGDDRLLGGGSADKLYGGPDFDYCDGQGRIGRSRRCEAGPRH